MSLHLKHPYCRIEQIANDKVVVCRASQLKCEAPQGGKLCLDCFEEFTDFQKRLKYLDEYYERTQPQ